MHAIYPKILVKSFREKTTSERKTSMPIRDVLQLIACCAIRSETIGKMWRSGKSVDIPVTFLNIAQ
jgi:hypothetical protein